ncbi:unnamed protein product, partial [Effrenium voratum]
MRPFTPGFNKLLKMSRRLASAALAAPAWQMWHGRRRNAACQGPFAFRFKQDTEHLLRQNKVQMEPELLDLRQKVQDLVKHVDQLACEDGAKIPDAQEFSDVRRAYMKFIQALKAVNDSVLGSKPLSSTCGWAPVLLRWRYYVCSLFSWGLLTEDAVQEAGALLRSAGVQGLVDPLAGSGWHARLWHEVTRLDTVALDSYSVRPVAWHQVLVVTDSRTAEWGLPAGTDLSSWALLLSWPPHSPETVGLDLLRAWGGNFLVYVGEQADDDDMGLTGGRALLEALERDWEPVQCWSIPCWPGFADLMTVYSRRK